MARRGLRQSRGIGLPLSVLIAESVGAEDFYFNRTDGFAANEVLRIQQVRSRYRIAFDRKSLNRAILEADRDDYGILHISCHGDDEQIGLTDGTAINWPDLAGDLLPFANSDRALVLSSCSGGYVGVTKAFQKAGVAFQYVFGSTSPAGVGFTDSCLAWSILYSQIVEHGFSRPALRSTLDKINAVVPGDFVYRRWNGSRYLHYPSFAQR